MPSAISHIAVPLAIRLGFRNRLISTRLLILAICCSMLPDLDVIGFHLGVPYSSQWGHRGFTHSIGFAVLLATVTVFFSRWLNSRRWVIFFMILIATYSHALLDSATNGGLGCALFWPVTEARYFLPWTPIQVSPISIELFLSGRGLAVLESELVWIWLPSLMLAVVIFITELIATGLIITFIRRKKAATAET